MSALQERLASLSPRQRAVLEKRLRERGLQVSELPIPERAENRSTFPLSFSQERLWFLHQMEPTTTAYHLASPYRLDGEPLDAGVLKRALRTIQRRHETLRTTFPVLDGEPVQRVGAKSRVELPLIDLTGLEAVDREATSGRLVRDEIRRPFDLERGSVLRAGLLRLGSESHVLLLTLHHIVSDGWSMRVLWHELMTAYAAILSGEQLRLPHLPIQFGDWAAWQRQRLRAEALDDEMAFWRRQLEGAPPLLELPLDRPRPPLQSYRGAARGVHISERLTAAVQHLARRTDATVFMVQMAAFQLLLARYASTDDLSVGTPVSGRDRQETEGLIGFFVNTLVMRAVLSSRQTFAELLDAVRQTVLAVHDHQDLPFERLVEELQPERNLAYSPIFQVMFSTLGAGARSGETPGLGGLSVTAAARGMSSTPFDLYLELHDQASGLLFYSTDLFDASTVTRFIGHYLRLLEAVTADPGQPVLRLALLSEGERGQLVHQLNDTARRALPPSVYEAVAGHAERRPGETAVSAGGVSLSYGELFARSSALGRHLRRLGVVPEVRVGVAMGRSPELVVALLGVHCAGGAYVPMDPAYPSERLAFMVEDSGLSVLLTDRELEAELRQRLPLGDIAVVTPDHLEVGEERPAPAPPPSPESAAYAIYTSGSTGRPKGVVVSHGALANFLASMARRPGLGSRDVLLAVTSPSFDIAALELFGPLVAGGRVEIAGAEEVLDGRALGSRIRGCGATVLQATPATWRMLLASGWVPGSSPRVLCGGEALPEELARDLLAGDEVWNLYGPTETTVWSSVARLRRGDSPTIGRPIANTRVHVLDRWLEPVLRGVAGQLWIAGRGLARGYHSRPALTAGRFVPDPFADASPGFEAGGRLYATGDLARVGPDGGLICLGRLDNQVKLRGYRIELGEVEAALAGRPDVEQAVVALKADAAGEPRLVAYLVAAGGAVPEASALRRGLEERLPAHLVPSAYVVLEALPLTPNRKVDREALPEPEADRAQRTREMVAPRGALERALGRIWAAVLGLDEVGVRDSFFELGGHSLLLVRVQSRIAEDLGRTVSVVDLFRHPTIESLAAHLDPSAGAERVGVLAGPGRAEARKRARREDLGAVAVVGLAGRFPGAPDVAELWQNLRLGVETVSFFSDEELLAAGLDRETLDQPGFVPALGLLEDADLFDNELFGVPPREAAATDPQQRIFLECAWAALENAGLDPSATADAIGVFAGTGVNRYLQNLASDPRLIADLGDLGLMVGNDKDFLATRTAYKLDLKGPAVSVQTACSTSLVAVHMACQSLLNGECDAALAGGVSLIGYRLGGYVFQEGGILSPDGHCRPFDAGAGGTVGSSGVGVVVLKPLDAALAAGDTIHAVIRGSAINNDGARKVGFTAPSVEGQAKAVAEAWSVAGVDRSSVGFIEAHGTATALGDPIEVTALNEVFGAEPGLRCALGSVKSNFGHLDAAAGVAGLIKALLAVREGAIPPSLHFEKPNPRLGLEDGPFYVADSLQPWPAAEGPRRAGVSSFGLGGTNCHVVLEQAPPAETAPRPSRARQLLTLSAATESALEASAERLAAHLAAHPDLDLADAAHTLRVGRQRLRHRAVVSCTGPADAVEVLRARDPRRFQRAVDERRNRPVAFLFPGLGDQALGMGRDLYEREGTFRAAVDRCAELLEPRLGVDLREVILAGAPEGESEASREVDLKRLLGRQRPAEGEAGRRLRRTELAQPAVFVVEWALAALWREWGIEPEALIGYSLGEYTAACVAGVFSLEDALAVVAERARFIAALPAGAMLAVPLAEEDLVPLLGEDLDLAASNAPSVCVAAGPVDAVERLEEVLGRRGVSGQRLAVEHAFHSAAMRPVAEALERSLRKLELHPPRIPLVSNVTGTWMTAAEAADPRRWVRHLLGTVRFAEGLAGLLEEPERILLEVGPGSALSTAARQLTSQATVVTSLPASGAAGQESLLDALGRLWLFGAPVSWPGFVERESRRRVPLPTYPFEGKRFWLEPGRGPVGARGAGERSLDLSDWFWAPFWRPAELAPEPQASQLSPCLLLAEAGGLSAALEAALREAGATVATVTAGEAFEDLGGLRFTADPRRGEDFAALVAELASTVGIPRTVVHAWSVDPAPAPDGVDCAALLDRGFYSLLFLAQALGARSGAEPLQLLALTSECQEVRLGEGVVPEKAAVLGLCQVIPQEHGGVRCAALDVALDADDGVDVLARRILDELLAGLPDAVVALRGGRRWVEDLTSLRLAPAEPAARLREGGCYLITGGLGGIGLALAAELAAACSARLVLTGRSPLPPREGWTRRLDEGPEEPSALRIQEAIRGVLALEEAGSEVLTLAADAADAEAMAAVVRAARERFGPIHGVIHAAGVPGAGLIQLKTREIAAAVLDPKVEGARVLSRVLADETLDFAVLLSSVAGVLGGIGQADYAAANAALDAWSRKGFPNASRTLSLAYGAWRETGLATRLEVAPQYRDEHEALLRNGLTTAEGVEAFRRALARSEPRVLVWPRDLRSALAEGRALSRSGGGGAEWAGPAAMPAHSRPSLPTPYVEPREGIEAGLAGIWQGLLGIDRVGAHDPFLDLGGDSLLAVRLVARIRQELHLEVSVQSLYETPTVAGLAAAVEEGGAESELAAIEDELAAIEDLSEAEVFEQVAERTGGGR